MIKNTKNKKHMVGFWVIMTKWDMNTEKREKVKKSIFSHSEYPDWCGGDPWPCIHKPHLLFFIIGILMKTKASVLSSLPSSYHEMRLRNRRVIHGKSNRNADIAPRFGPRTKIFCIHIEDLWYYPPTAYKSLLTPFPYKAHYPYMEIELKKVLNPVEHLN